VNNTSDNGTVNALYKPSSPHCTGEDGKTMKITGVSDSHGEKELMKSLISLQNRFGSASWRFIPRLQGFKSISGRRVKSVRGNCDGKSDEDECSISNRW
jgi:predicted phosphodiesterase